MSYVGVGSAIVRAASGEARAQGSEAMSEWLSESRSKITKVRQGANKQMDNAGGGKEACRSQDRWSKSRERNEGAFLSAASPRRKGIDEVSESV